MQGEVVHCCRANRYSGCIYTMAALQLSKHVSLARYV